MAKKSQKKLPIGKKIPAPLAPELIDACEGLFYISETDAPITSIAIDGDGIATRDELLRALGWDGNAPVEDISAEQFFAKLTAEKDWHGDREKKRTTQFRRINEILTNTLTDLKVFRIGATQIKIFAVGRDKNGDVSGIETYAVET